jgi:hypothetical protein
VSDDTLEINGWTIYAHPLFLDQLEAMIGSVEQARRKDPRGYKNKRAAKLLAAVLKVAFEDIPANRRGAFIDRAVRSPRNTSIGSGQNSCSSSACSFAIGNRRAPTSSCSLG